MNFENIFKMVIKQLQENEYIFDDPVFILKLILGKACTLFFFQNFGSKKLENYNEKIDLRLKKNLIRFFLKSFLEENLKFKSG